MKKVIIPLLASLLTADCARADTTLTVNSGTPYGCLQNAFVLPSPLAVTGNFSLNDSSGTGTIQSSVTATAPTFSYPPEIYFYNYTIDLCKIASPASQCVRLVIHFGTPEGCDFDEVWGSPSQIQSASLAPFGDITFSFSGGCLSPGEGTVGFTMLWEALPRTNIVTVIDDYVNPANWPSSRGAPALHGLSPASAGSPTPCLSRWIYLPATTIAIASSSPKRPSLKCMSWSSRWEIPANGNMSFLRAAVLFCDWINKTPEWRGMLDARKNRGRRRAASPV